jgi:hypothetical protein
MHQCLSCTLKGFLSLLMCRRESERTFLHHLLHGLVGFLILVDTEDYEVVCLVLVDYPRLEPRFEPRLLPSQHESSLREVVDADLSGYFDTIPHGQLMKSLARRISDGAMLELLKKWRPQSLHMRL